MQVALIVLFALAFSSCWPKKAIVQFSKPEGNSFMKGSYRESIKNPGQISVLLRVPYTPSKASEVSVSSFNSLFSTIETELSKNGFSVRDRQIFNELISTNKESMSDISRVTQTDLIIEVVDLDIGVKYTTDNFLNAHSRKKVFLKNGSIKMTGARIGFKIYAIKSNELISYQEFNYAPCEEGCKLKVDKDGTVYSYKNGKYIRAKNYQTIEKDQFEEFSKIVAKNLINKLK